MTWSITHTMPGSSGAENHAALTYLFDTYLTARANWTIAAHPSPAAFKRSVQYTVPVNKATGAPYTFYHWVTWSSTSTAAWYWYEDATYTTTPGDLGTDGTNSIGLNFDTTNSFFFCTSTDQPDAVLIFKGPRVFMYFPHIAEGLFYPDPTWNGSVDNKGTHVAPYVGGYDYALVSWNAPISSNTDGSNFRMAPDIGYGASSQTTNTGNPARIVTKFNWLYSNSTSTPNPSSYSSWAFADGKADTGIMLPATQVSANNRFPFPYQPVTTYQIGTDYWIHSSNAITDQSVCFNFGNSDPGIS